MRSIRGWNCLALALLAAVTASCAERDPFAPAGGLDRPQLAVVPAPVVIDFEGLANLEVITGQFADQGVVFSRAAALDTSSGGLNRNFADPRSGEIVAFNCVNNMCGAMTLSFPEALAGVGAYVTGFEPVTLTCFDAGGAELGSTATPGRNVKNNPDGLPLHIFLEVAAPDIASCSIVSQNSVNTFIIDDLTLSPQPQGVTVRIDVQQGTINRKSKGVVAVAVLSDAGFNAVAEVDLRTVTLGDGSAEDTPVARRRNRTYMAAGEDVDGDGDRDLVLHFSTASLVTNGDLTSATTELVLRGATKSGVAFAGSDDVRVVH